MSNVAAAPSNPQRLLWAGFFSIFAAGVGFSVRGGILGEWAKNYGFTNAELGAIAGAALWGFGISVIAGSIIADKIGYGWLMVFAFVLHVLSAALQMCTDLINAQFGRDGVSWALWIAMGMFAVANGTCETVVNPMVATLFPKQKTHFLNILHAGWPGGLMIGALLSYVMNWLKVPWIIQMSTFLIPTLIYGVMLLGQRLPKSEAAEAGVSYRTMLLEFASPILLLLLLIHAMVGYVELGTDSWIPKITSSIMVSPGAGLLLFVYTSGLMFALRFFAGPIEHKMSPLGLLFASAVFAAAGLLFLGNAHGVVICVIAATIYGIGKTFFWPTMLAVVSERFPRGGALTIGAVGGVGMLSAGFLGNPLIGYKQDYYATSLLKDLTPEQYEQIPPKDSKTPKPSYETMKKAAADAYQRYSVEKDKITLFFLKVKGLDGSKAGILDLETKILGVQEKLANPDLKAEERKALELELKEHSDELEKTFKNEPNAEVRDKLTVWWAEAKPSARADETPITAASLYGGRMALIWTAAVPAMMALLYLFLILYFKAQGGYKAVVIESGGRHSG